MEVLVIVTSFIENIQSVEVVEESRLLERELNGEIHIITFLRNFTKLLVRNVLISVKLHEGYID